MLNQKEWISWLLAVGLSVTSFSSFAAPKYGSGTVPLSRDTQFFKKNDAPDYWAIAPYYVPQQDGRSCSVATVAMLVNALRSRLDLSQDEPLVTQSAVLKKTNLSTWKRSVGGLGRGVTLEQLREISATALQAYGIAGYQVELNHADARNGMAKSRFLEALKQNEKNREDIILINFDQKILTGDPEGVGHISPIGAYDAQTQRVLVMDTDREWYEPYWVSWEKAFEAMSTQDSASSKTRGYIWIKK